MWFILVLFYRQKLRRKDLPWVMQLGRVKFLDSLASAHSLAPVRSPMELIKIELPLLFFMADP